MSSYFFRGRNMFHFKLHVLALFLLTATVIANRSEISQPLAAAPFLDEANSHLVSSTVKRYGRKLAATLLKDIDDGKGDVRDLHLTDADLEDDLDLDGKEEDDNRVWHNKHIPDDKALSDGNKEHEKPMSMEELNRVAKEIGLTDEDLKDLDDLEAEKRALRNMGHRDKDSDDRPRDAPPPPGMVGNPDQMKNVGTRLDPERELEASMQLSPKEPYHYATNSTGTSKDRLREKLKRENIAYEQRVQDLSRDLEDAQREMRAAQREASQARDRISALETQHERSKRAFQQSLASAREEEKSAKIEMTSTIKEQEKAFDELFEEKQLLSQMLSDEQKTLKELQEKIQHPDLGLWVRQRAERAAILVETPETDAVKYYAKKYMAPKVTKMRHRLEVLEKRVERTVDHLLPAKYGSVVALLLSIGLIGFPVMVTMSMVVSITKSVSLRQYVLLGNVFLTAFAAALCVAGIMLRQDPLQTLYEASETLFITLQLTTAIVFPVFLGLIGCTVVRSRDRLDAFVFGCEFVFYSLVAINYRSRVWRPAMLGQNIETSVMMYAIYLMDFMSMTALTISSSKVDVPSILSDRDPEVGLDRKLVSGTGSGPLHTSVSSRVTSIGSGLMHAAMGHGRTGKSE